MLSNALTISAVGLFLGSALAQSTPSPHLDRAIVRHGDSVVTLVANAPLPLFQAISAVREEYGWQVNFEQAPGYSHFDVVDDTAPEWRRNHPGGKGVTGAAGGSFTSTFPEVRDALDVTTERDVLAKVLQDYNGTDNPGKYGLQIGHAGEFTIVGTAVRDETGALQEVPPILSTPVTIEREQRSLYDSVTDILRALSSAAGQKVIVMSVPNNEFRTTQLTMGGDKVPARQLLEQALASTLRPLQYDLGYDPDVPVYILSISVAATAKDDGRGGRMLLPTDRSQSVTYLVKISEEQGDAISPEARIKTCMLIFPDGRFQFERRKRFSNSKPNLTIFESSMNSIQLNSLQDILDRETIKSIPRYMSVSTLPRIKGFNAEIARGGGKVQSVGYWILQEKASEASPEIVPNNVKKVWLESEIALRPLVEWFHGVEAMKLDESPTKSSLCDDADNAETAGNSPNH